MYLCVKDKLVTLSICLIRAVIDEELREKLATFQVESDEIVCYSPEERDKIIAILDENDVSYTIEEISWPTPIVEKVSGMNFLTRSEVLRNILAVTVSPNPVAIDEVVMVTAFLPPYSSDTEITFQVEGGQQWREQVVNCKGTHAFVFTQPGIYQITVSSLSHGKEVVEVVVQ